MRRLGYERYGAAGNDAGSMISPEVGRLDPDHVVGVHVTQIFSFPSGDPSEFEGMTPEEMTELGTLQWFFENKMSFNKVFSEQPQTVAYAITDSPLGLLAWNAQLLGEDLDADFQLSNVMLYWLTGTAASAGRLYYENAHAENRPTEPTTVPLGLAGFGGDFSGIRRFAERDHSEHRQLEHVPERRAFRGPQGPERADRRHPGVLPLAPLSKRRPRITQPRLNVWTSAGSILGDATKWVARIRSARCRPSSSSGPVGATRTPSDPWQGQASIVVMPLPTGSCVIPIEPRMRPSRRC